MFPEEEFSDAFSRFGLITLRRRPRPRPAELVAAAAGGADDSFVPAPTLGADTVTETAAGVTVIGDFTGDDSAGADVLGLAGSGLVWGLALVGTMAGELSGVLVTVGSLLVEGLGGSMLSFGT